jgi:hypothetical protein
VVLYQNLLTDLLPKFSKYIVQGKIEPIHKIPYHTKAPIRRLSMAGKTLLPSARTHLAVHFVDATKRKIPEYTRFHKHNYDEINLIISEKSKLVYKIEIENESYTVTSPATVFIPKNTLHKANVISGKGIFVCMIKSSKYRTR